MIKGFKDFQLRGNGVDLAVAVVIGAAFASVVGAFTGSIIKPLLAAVSGGDSYGFGPTLRAGNPATFVDFGAVITALLNFVIVAAVIYFLIVIPMNHLMALRKQGAEPEPVAPAEDVIVLQEIRDLLRAQQR